MSEVNPKSIIEALFFATDEPVAAKKIAEIIKIETLEVRRLLKEMKSEYDEAGRGFEIIEVAGGWQILSREDFGEYVKQLHKTYAQAKLSQSALETLAVIAYKQPVLRAEIDAIRGVNTGPLVRTLIDRGLVKIVGRADTLGRPTLYGTTRKFLERFSLKSLKELPQAEDAEARKREEAESIDAPDQEQMEFDLPEVNEEETSMEQEGTEQPEVSVEETSVEQDQTETEESATTGEETSMEIPEAEAESNDEVTMPDDIPVEREIEEVVASSQN
ncbi:MAG: SMC-Scp complex subunit ScpB [Planctomycetota bacterium]|nr:SMC-Scp complex subunit ScpB [Planctomycetota bacterium]MDA1140189.1 SMC-Scp complex subunit ScpB [Planctomycetota bacterium]